MKQIPYKRLLLILIAFLLIGIGIAGKEPDLIMQKAVKICLECIGIG